MAEFKISVSKPGEISFNYEELKAEVSAKAAEYASFVYTPATIGDAKADRAKLNKLKTALNDERIRREKEFLQPFAEFKSQVNEIIKILEEPISAIDTQVKEMEANDKRDKRNSCMDVFLATDHPEWLTFEQIENPKWYNKTTSMASIKDEIEAKINHHIEEFNSLANYSASPFEAQEYYKRTLNFHDAMAEGQRVVEIAKAKAKLVENTEEDEDAPEWLAFEALVTPRTAKMLAGWCKLNGIKLRKHTEE